MIFFDKSLLRSDGGRVINIMDYNLSNSFPCQPWNNTFIMIYLFMMEHYIAS